jgi:hypothetical protein
LQNDFLYLCGFVQTTQWEHDITVLIGLPDGMNPMAERFQDAWAE